jgi:hypothetical protein
MGVGSLSVSLKEKHDLRVLGNRGSEKYLEIRQR